MRTRNLANKRTSHTSLPPSSIGGGGGGSQYNLWVEAVLDDQDSTKSPPGSPVTGDRYIVPGAATGAWSGKGGLIAQWSGSAWTFHSDTPGSLVYVKNREKYCILCQWDSTVIDSGYQFSTAGQTAGMRAWIDLKTEVHMTESYAGGVIYSATSPPGSPSFTNVYIVGSAGASGAWVGRENHIAWAVRDQVSNTYKWVFRAPHQFTYVLDVASAPTTVRFMRWNGSAWVPFPRLDQLEEVNVVEGVGIDGYVLTWNNGTGKWIAAVGPAAAPHTLVSHSDVNITPGPGIDGYAITWDNGTSKWIASPAPVPAAHALGTHSDVTISGPVTNQVLQYNGTRWVNATLTVPTLDGLSNVNTSGKATGDGIKWNGSQWVKWTPVLADMSDVSNSSPSTGQVLGWTGTEWAPTTISATLPTGVGRLAALWTGGSGSGTWTYTTLGTTGFDGSWPYWVVPAGYTRIRVTVQYGGSRGASGVAGGGTSSIAGNEVGLIVASGGLTAGLWTNVVQTFSSIAAGTSAIYISPAFNITAGRRVYPLLNSSGVAPYVAINPTYIQIELFT